MKWKIWYSDGRTIDDTQKDPFELSGTRERSGVLVIVQPAEDGRSGWILTSGDHNYIWEDLGDGFKWVGANDTGLLLYLLKPGPKCVIFGETVSNKRFREIHQLASQEFGEKHNFDRRERHP